MIQLSQRYFAVFSSLALNCVKISRNHISLHRETQNLTTTHIQTCTCLFQNKYRVQRFCNFSHSFLNSSRLQNEPNPLTITPNTPKDFPEPEHVCDRDCCCTLLISHVEQPSCGKGRELCAPREGPDKELQCLSWERGGQSSQIGRICSEPFPSISGRGKDRK